MSLIKTDIIHKDDWFLKINFSLDLIQGIDIQVVHNFGDKLFFW